ncbi:hypothetical protein AB0D57_19060 [Streptomyces sp. NPDC048275]|uniref:hypothetical protein n=1 Tax=Streptomyces sp. NPDC048275 TaxID=3155629 RepID=UPI003406714B
MSAGVGLLGAIGGAAVGGVAAARGARLGAETTARATAKQVHDQASVDHEHWLRGQRLEACRILLAAYDEYAIAASMLTRALEREVEGSRDVGQAFGQAVSAFRNAYWQVRLVGSADVREHASRLRRHLEDHKDCVDQWLDAALSMQGATIASARAEEERLRVQLGELHDAFMETASRAVSERPAIV